MGPPEVFCPQRMASRFLGFTLRSSHHALQKTEGREHLRRLLNWEEFDELRDSRRSILLDTLYESIIFAVGKGFPWVEVAKVVKFTEELIKETKGMRHPGQKSGGLQGEGDTEDPSAVRSPFEGPGAPSFFSLTFSILACSSAGFPSRLSVKWNKQNVLAEFFPLVSLAENLAPLLAVHTEASQMFTL